MSREDTKKKSALDSMFEELENDKEDKHELDLKPKQVESDDSKNTPPPESKPEPESKQASKPKPNKPRAKKYKAKEVKVSKPNVSFGKKPETVNQNFRVDPEIKELVYDMTHEDGKTIKGSKGFLKVFATNAIIKEMVHLGALDESYLDNLIPYEEE